MNFVADASVTLSWILADEITPETDRLLQSFEAGAIAFVPALWRWEVGNALLVAERRNRLTSSETQNHLSMLDLLPVEIDSAAVENAWGSSCLLARKHSLTLYDAAYLELAIRRGLPLATLDARLRTAGTHEGVRILPESS